MKWILSFLFGKDLSTVLNETKTVRVSGVRFKIRKVNIVDYLAGNKVMLQSFDVYKTGLEPSMPKSENAEKKLREHYAQVLVSGVMHPRLKLKPEGEGILVDDLFIDWDMAIGVYNEIMLLTYGKKKIQESRSRAAELSKSTP